MASNANSPRDFFIGKLVFRSEELKNNQQEALASIESGIRSILQRTQGFDATLNAHFAAEHPTYVFSILGPRGQGKTATLMTLCDKLTATGKADGIIVAPTLQPELLIKGEPVFPAIVYNLLRAARAALPNVEDRIPSALAELESGLYRFLEDSLARTPSGRTLLVELSGNLANYAQRFARSSSSYFGHIERFHDWVNSLLTKTGFKLLVFPIDDVDVCREHSEPILEAVRLYLSHPRIVVILTADFTTVRRSIRNNLLQQLPQVLQGGGGVTTTRDESASKRKGLPWPVFSPEQILGREFRADNDYTREFLYKVLPPALRVHLRGMRAAERLRSTIALPPPVSSQREQYSTRTSLARLLNRVPIVGSVFRQCKRDESREALTWPNYVSRIRDLLAGQRDAPSEAEEQSPSGTLGEICSWYSEAFPTTLRALVNQIIYIHRVVHEYCDHIELTLQPKRSEAPEDASSELSKISSFSTRKVGWFPELDDLAGDDNSKSLSSLKAAEDDLMMKVFNGLSLNPEIEDDRQLFFDEGNAQANALEAQTASAFWALTESIEARGTSVHGILWQHNYRTGQNEDLNEASSCLMNILVEYCISRSSSPWQVFSQCGIDELLAPNATRETRDIRRTVFIDALRKEPDPLPAETSPLARIVWKHIKTRIWLEPSTASPPSFKLAMHPPTIGPPCMISSLRQANDLLQYGYFVNEIASVNDVVDRFINQAHDEIYDLGRRQLAEARRPSPSLRVAAAFESAISYRVLGLVAYSTFLRILGLSASLTRVYQPPAGLRRCRSMRLDIDWLMDGDQTVGWYLATLFNGAGQESLMDRFLSLLYVSSLPMAPLMTAWQQDEQKSQLYGTASALIGVVHDLLVQAKAQWEKPQGLFRLTISFQAIEGYWKNSNPASRPVQINGISDAPFSTLQAYAPRCDLDAQANNVSDFLELLMHLQQVQSSASTTSPPDSWKQLVECICHDTIVAKKLAELASIASDTTTAEPSAE